MRNSGGQGIGPAKHEFKKPQKIYCKSQDIQDIYCIASHFFIARTESQNANTARNQSRPVSQSSHIWGSLPSELILCVSSHETWWSRGPAVWLSSQPLTKRCPWRRQRWWWGCLCQWQHVTWPMTVIVTSNATRLPPTKKRQGRCLLSSTVEIESIHCKNMFNCELTENSDHWFGTATSHQNPRMRLWRSPWHRWWYGLCLSHLLCLSHRSVLKIEQGRS